MNDLVKQLRDFAVELCKAEDALLVRDAADAIEELSKRVQELEYDPTCDPEWRDSPKGRQEDTLDW